MTGALTEAPPGYSNSFLGFPLALDLDTLDADIAILGVPYGLPYVTGDLANDQSRAPDAIRQNAQDAAWEEPRTRVHFDWDLGGPLLGNRPVKVVDCGNVTSDPFDPHEHYRRAEAAAGKIFQAGATLITLGGDHGIPIPIMRALPKHETITLVQVDAHMDWRDDVNGVREGYSSPMRRASEMDWIGDMVQIGLRGVGSARTADVDAARAHGAKLISAYEMHDMGMDAVLEQIPDGGPYYLTVDADGLDPTIMPAVNAPTPGGLTWIQIHKLIHGLVKKGRVVGMDLVEISPAFETGSKTLVHAERLLCNFIGATVRAGYYD
ncbi:MAG: arginase [Alphaproteobacteria bacterium]|nr:arginase [Alphaproteobacteria bacterium]